MSQLDEWQELMTKDEPVCDELAPYVFEDARFGMMLKHPLMFVVLGFDPKKAGLWNKQYREKLKYVKEAEAEGHYDRAMWMYERAHRLEYFSQVASKLTDEMYWEQLAHIITDSENLWQYHNLLKLLLASLRPNRHLMMTAEEQKALAAMPDELEVWRGCSWRNRNGLSWTIDKQRAIWFAKRFNPKKPYLHSGTVQKSDTIAYFTGRGEEEILVLPTRIKNKKLDPI